MVGYSVNLIGSVQIYQDIIDEYVKKLKGAGYDI